MSLHIIGLNVREQTLDVSVQTPETNRYPFGSANAVPLFAEAFPAKALARAKATVANGIPNFLISVFIVLNIYNKQYGLLFSTGFQPHPSHRAVFSLNNN